MDRDTELLHLTRAEKAIAEGQRRIAAQEQRVTRLDLCGQDTRRATGLLRLYRRVHAQHVAHRRIILELLSYTNRPEWPRGPIYRPGHTDMPARSLPT